MGRGTMTTSRPGTKAAAVGRGSTTSSAARRTSSQLRLRTRLLNEGLFQPPPAGKRTPRAAGLDYRRLDIETADGEALRGWWIEARSRRRGHLLFFHGNGE